MVQCDRDCILYNLTSPLFSTYLSVKWVVKSTYLVDIPKRKVGSKVDIPKREVGSKVDIPKCEVGSKVDIPK